MDVKPFFPDPLTAGIFFFVLVGFLSVAAYIDTKTFRIPKWLTLPLLGTGIIVNVIRGAWMASLDREVWVLGTGSMWLGAADGLLFALWGAAAAFGIYFAMWLIGFVKGGDVKLVTAIGAWIGAFNILLFIVASGAVLVLWTIGRLFAGGFTPRDFARRRRQFEKMPDMKKGEIDKFARRGMTFSVPAAVAAALVMLWVFRYDLQLVDPKPTPHNGSAHAPIHVAYR